MAETALPACFRCAGLALALGVLTGAAPAAAQGRNGKALYEASCATCHGRQGQDTARGRARRLGEIGKAAVREYLTSRRGAQGARQPYERLKAALSEAEIEALAGYIAGLPRP